MNNPPDSDTELSHDFDRALLRSAKGDEPAPGAAARAAVALGTAMASTAAGATAGAAAKTSLLTLVTKPFLVGLLGGAVVGGGAYLFRGEPEPALAPTVGSSVAVSPTIAETRALAPAATGTSLSPASAASSTEVSSKPPRRRDPEPEGELGPVAPSTAMQPSTLGSEASFPPLPTASATPGAGSIAEEIRSVDRAREALRQGRPGDALAEVARYRQRVLRGTLGTEISLLEIQAELALGHRETARDKARGFLAQHPGDSYRARVEALFPAGERP